MRFILNFLFGGLWVLLFNWLGWIHLSDKRHLVADPQVGLIVDAAVVALVIVVMGEIAAFVWATWVVVTLGLGCIFLPLYWLLVGYVKLNAAAFLLPGWFTYNHSIVYVLIMSWILGASRWHAPGEMRKDDRDDEG
ncbi:MAG: hypothetical protein FJX76_10835 [Armatimonadetes bacterium]|nr:hypothetical protein [Armatimonadota bacterium]